MLWCFHLQKHFPTRPPAHTCTHKDDTLEKGKVSGFLHVNRLGLLLGSFLCLVIIIRSKVVLKPLYIGKIFIYLTRVRYRHDHIRLLALFLL